jgi:acyl-CoA reductase-like NAD-dependent aldehyde dehydrogenase
MDPFSRGQLMHKLANLIEENLNELAYLETLNSGKPLKVTKNEDLPYTAYIYKYYAGQTDKIKGSTLAMSKPFFGLTKK